MTGFFSALRARSLIELFVLAAHHARAVVGQIQEIDPRAFGQFGGHDALGDDRGHGFPEPLLPRAAVLGVMQLRRGDRSRGVERGPGFSSVAAS